MRVKLNYQTFGAGHPVIILHGLLGSNRNWHFHAKQLANSFQVITVDLRNHGDSGHGQSMSFEEMAGDIADLFRELGLKKGSVIGHSMGGKVAIAFALLHRPLLDRLIVLDVAPVDYGTRFGHVIDAMMNLPLAGITSRREADESLAREIADTMLRQSLLQNLVRESDHFRWRPNLSAMKQNLSEIGGFDLPPTEPYREPVLFIGGGNSKYILPEYHAPIKKYFPQAEIHTIPDAGHWLQMDQPQQLLEEINRFLAPVREDFSSV